MILQVRRYSQRASLRLTLVTTRNIKFFFELIFVLGLFSLDQKSALSTTNGLYTLEQEQLGKDRLQKVADAPYPNIWLSPDVS